MTILSSISRYILFYYFSNLSPLSLLFPSVSLPKQKGLDRSVNLVGDRDQIGGSLDFDAEKLRKIGLETRQIDRDRSSP